MLFRSGVVEKEAAIGRTPVSVGTEGSGAEHGVVEKEAAIGRTPVSVGTEGSGTEHGVVEQSEERRQSWQSRRKS